MTNFSELEELAKKYAQLKFQKEVHETFKRRQQMEKLAEDIIDYFSQQDFQFPLDEHVLSSNGKTTYVYENNSTFQNLFEFLSELLHLPIPIMIGAAKFGPGEIIVNVQDGNASSRELKSCIAELKNLVFAKKSKMA